MKVGHWPAGSVRNVPLSTGIAALVVAGAAPLLGWALAEERWGIAILLTLGAAVPIVLRWPVISTLGVYAFLVPFDFVTVFPEMGASLTRFVGLMAAAVLVATGLMERRLVRPPLAALVWGLFMLWAILSVVWSVDPRGTVRGLTMLLSVFLLYLAAVCFRASAKEFGWICALAVLGGMAAAASTVVVGGADAYSSSTRAGLVIGEQGARLNAFALSLILPLVLAMGGFMAVRNLLGKALAIVAVSVIATGFYLTMSRGALVGLAASAVVLLYRFRMRWQILLVACLLIGVAAVMPDAFLNRVASLADKDDTGAGRTKIWAIGLDAVQRHGVIGSGLSTFSDVYTQTVALSPSKSGGRAGHNTYLTAWVEVGIVGLVVLAAAVFCHLFEARRIGRRVDATAVATRAIEAACYGVLVSVFFGDYLWTKYFWLPWILLAWGLQRVERRASLPTRAKAEHARAEEGALATRRPVLPARDAQRRP